MDNTTGMEIAKAINNLASAVGGIGTILFFTMIFKNMSGDNESAINHLADVIEKFYNKR